MRRSSRSDRAVLAAAAILVVALALGFVVLGRAHDPGSIGSATGPSSIPSVSVLGPTSSVSGSASAGPTSALEASPVASPTASVPAFRHVYVIVMENREYGRIVGDSHAPYINELIARYGLATNYTAVAHPSEPNYLALFSGSTHGVTDDGVHDLTAPNLADQLEAAGRTWRVYAENVPAGCYRGGVARGGSDGAGTYARKHEPAISFSAIASDPKRCAAIQNLGRFDPAAADFELIVPNMCHDGHDCSTAEADAFLRRFVPDVVASPEMADSVLFLTWDEGTSSIGGGGRVVTVVIGPGVRPGFRSALRHSHYSLVRTIEGAWGLPCLAHSCEANDLGEFFGPG